VWVIAGFVCARQIRESAENQPAFNGWSGLFEVDDQRAMIRGDRFPLPRLAIDLGPDHARFQRRRYHQVVDALFLFPSGWRIADANRLGPEKEPFPGLFV
jgi:hypothetical protein